MCSDPRFRPLRWEDSREGRAGGGGHESWRWSRSWSLKKQLDCQVGKGVSDRGTSSCQGEDWQRMRSWKLGSSLRRKDAYLWARRGGQGPAGTRLVSHLDEPRGFPQNLLTRLLALNVEPAHIATGAAMAAPAQVTETRLSDLAQLKSFFQLCPI